MVVEKVTQLLRAGSLISIASMSMLIVAAPPIKMRLSPKDVAELVLKQGPATSLVNDEFVTTRFATATAFLPFDWKVELESGYEYDKGEAIDRANSIGTTYKSTITDLALTKAFRTGTKFGVNYAQRSRDADYTLGSQQAPGFVQLPKASQGELGLTVEQSLLNNFFGVGDRATIRSAEKVYTAAGIDRLNKLEGVVLSALNDFWNAYVAETTFQEALASRDRFKSLVAQVRRKSSVGYANPGELAQAQADFEAQEQAVKTASTTYLTSIDGLLTNLNLPPDTAIEFAVSTSVPPVPKLEPIPVNELRSIRAQQLQLEAAKDLLTAANTKRYPELNLVGRYATTGFDESSDGAFSRLSTASHPRYYVGGKLVYNFGSNYQGEEIVNRRAQRDLAQTNLNLQTARTVNALAQEQRQVEATYAIMQSAIRQSEHRERAVRELTRTYGQGRTDVKVLIDAINNQFQTKVGLARAIGDYQIALNRWAASRDELIPESPEQSSQAKENRQ